MPQNYKTKLNSITLISDFGSGLFYVARLKAALSAVAPHIPVVDLSHDIASWDIKAGYFQLALTHTLFTQPAIHLFGVNYNSPHHIAAFKDPHWYLAPNHGVLPQLLGEEGVAYYDIGHCNNPAFMELLYVPVVSKIVNQQFLTDYVEGIKPQTLLFPKPVLRNRNLLQVDVAMFDRAGNVVVNIKQSDFLQFIENQAFKIFVSPIDYVTQLTSSYFNQPSCELIAFFNNAGYLELRYMHGNLKSMFGLNEDSFVIIEKSISAS